MSFKVHQGRARWWSHKWERKLRLAVGKGQACNRTLVRIVTEDSRTPFILFLPRWEPGWERNSQAEFRVLWELTSRRKALRTTRSPVWLLSHPSLTHHRHSVFYSSGCSSDIFFCCHLFWLPCEEFCSCPSSCPDSLICGWSTLYFLPRWGALQDPGARVWLFKALAIMTVKRAGLSRWAGLHCDVTRLCYSWVIYMKLGDPSNAAQGYPQCCSLFFFFNDKWGFPDRCYWVPKFQSYVGHLESTRGIKRAISCL